MSIILPFDALMRLLDDPAMLAALLAGGDPGVAPELLTPDATRRTPAPDPAPVAEAPLAGVPDDAFPTIEELDALLAESYAPQPGIDAAMRAELAEALGLDPALIDDADAFMAALATLEPPPEDVLPEAVSGEPTWDPTWVEAGREDWALG